MRRASPSRRCQQGGNGPDLVGGPEDVLVGQRGRQPVQGHLVAEGLLDQARIGIDRQPDLRDVDDLVVGDLDLPVGDVDAVAAPARAVGKVPIRMRNSPTKPLSPGTPMLDSITTMKAAAKIGATACMPFRSAMRRVWRRS